MSEQKIIQGDCLSVLKTLEKETVDCVVTSPPYFGLRDYGHEAQIGLEETPQEYTQKLVEVFREIRRVLKKEGTVWLNLGDSYAGSGRGRDSDGEWNPGKGGSKQETNVGATSGRRVNEKSYSKKLIEKGAIGNKWVKPPVGLKQKDLIGIPWRVAFALQADGWYLRQDIIWSKPNPMPESVTDRCTKSHEYIFLLSRSKTYFFDADAIKEPAIYGSIERLARGVSEHHKNVNGAPGQTPHSFQRARENIKDSRAGKGRIAYGGKRNGEEGTGQESFVSISEYRNKRSVWSITTKGYAEAHFATFPEDLIEPMVLAGCPRGGVLMDPFSGSGTTGVVGKKFGRSYIGIELNPEYVAISERRLAGTTSPLFS